jgi:3-dehydroquinate dehydratase/shikimate dehydrogenase
MLCVSIGRGRHRHLIAEHRHLVEQGAKMVELRLDYLQSAVNVKRLLADRPGPVVISCRRERDGGKCSLAEPDRQLLLRTAISEGADYVDIEEDIAATIPRFGKTKRIISLHNFRQTPADLEAIHARMSSLDADIVKIATMANQPADNLRMLRLIRDSKIPTVGICMGDLGMPTRILAGKFGAAFTFATFHQERALAPGQLSFAQMTETYHYDQIRPRTKVFGVIADPVGHSLSPLIHNAAFAQAGIDAVYVPFRVPREHFAEFLDHAAEWDLHGLSVTIPHKETVLEKLTERDAWVEGIGAANTIVFDGEARRGYNTDCQAAMESLEQVLATDGAAVSLAGKTALVLGAGGAAKAIAFGLRQRGANVVIASRTLDRAKLLADRLEARVVDWKLRHSVAPQIIVNCTPVGMHPNVDESPFDKHHLKPSMTVFDTVYNPESTLLIKFAREQSCRVVTGIEMFVRQAALQFKLFTGQEAPMDIMAETLRRAIGPVKYYKGMSGYEI